MVYTLRMTVEDIKKAFPFEVVIQKDKSINGWFARVPSIHACHTQADTLPELLEHLKEVLALCQEVARDGLLDNSRTSESIGKSYAKAGSRHAI